MAMKEDFWSNTYNIANNKTNISRLRKGDTVPNAINYFKTLKTFPNLKKKVFLGVNFISKAELEDRLNKLRDAEEFKERNEVKQIYGFIPSLVSSCYEVGSEIYIICKP